MCGHLAKPALEKIAGDTTGHVLTGAAQLSWVKSMYMKQGRGCARGDAPPTQCVLVEPRCHISKSAGVPYFWAKLNPAWLLNLFVKRGENQDGQK